MNGLRSKTLWCLSAILLWGALCGGRGMCAPSMDAEKMLKAASVCFGERDYDGAIKEYGAALSEVHDAHTRAAVLFMLSSCWLEKGIVFYTLEKDDSFYKKALCYAAGALKHDRRYWYAFANIGTVHMNRGELKEADRYFTRAIRYANADDPGFKMLVERLGGVKRLLVAGKEKT